MGRFRFSCSTNVNRFRVRAASKGREHDVATMRAGTREKKREICTPTKHGGRDPVTFSCRGPLRYTCTTYRRLVRTLVRRYVLVDTVRGITWQETGQEVCSVPALGASSGRFTFVFPLRSLPPAVKWRRCAGLFGFERILPPGTLFHLVP